MKKGAHIDDRSMRSILLGGGIGDAVVHHLDNCADCRERLNGLKKILAPSDTETINPSPEMERRVLAAYWKAYRTSARLSLVEAIRGVLNGLNRKAAAGALAFVIVAAGAGFFVYKIRDPRPLPLYVYHIRGKALVDGSPVNYQSTIYEGSLIDVPRKSILVLSYKNHFLLKIHENSELRLGRAMMKHGRGQAEFVFKLIKGTLFTRFNNPEGEPEYFYMTPNARIKSSRTEFILKVAGNKTILIPRSGTINITSLETREEVLTLPDKKYVITSTIETNESGEYEDVREQLSNDAENPLGESGHGEAANPLGPIG